MKNPDFKPITPEDFGMSPEEIEALVKGAQEFLSTPQEDDPDDIKDSIDDKGN